MKFQKYIFRGYSSKFPALFNKEKHKLENILTKDARIKHIGSSAIPGLGGKGIIDVLVAVKKKNINENREKLQKYNYVFKPNAGSKERKFFEKDYVYGRKTRRVHVHLTSYNGSEFRQKTAFIEYLKKHPEVVGEYAKLKKEATKYAKGEGKKYREYKHKFLEKLNKKALKEFSK
jgi:GrpB-like predicted nucleotidyltransferase (UPF0157 family)